jgi:hypothetical protein
MQVQLAIKSEHVYVIPYFITTLCWVFDFNKFILVSHEDQ